jgi:hypothetical protein
MLQISTGKFFKSDDLTVTRHRAVLYSNYKLFRDAETEAGALRRLGGGGDVVPLLYDYEERLEAVRPDGRREFIASIGADQMLQDFAAVASFTLNITCTPDADLARRLTRTERPPLGAPLRPSQYVVRVFDPALEPDPRDGERLAAFVSALLGLERATYEVAIRAIRRYVTGLHRVSDDLDLAYALLVASIESVAQQFDDFSPRWEDYDQARREAVDAALKRTDASPATAEALRSALLEREHAALARRYREFAVRHVLPAFYREEAAGLTNPVRARDLSKMLEQAYTYRSKYVHELRELPRVLTHTASVGDVLRAEGRLSLTFQGMARVAHHVIRTFVARGRKVERGDVDYRRAFPNVVRMSLADSFWLHSAAGFDHRSAQRYLAGFLRELAHAMAVDPTASLTAMPDVLEKVERTVRGLAKPAQRVPMLTLYLLYNAVIKGDARRPNFGRFIELHAKDFDEPSAESFLAHVLLGNTVPWPAERLAGLLDAYYARRGSAAAPEFPPLFEAALTLVAAESFRVAGDHARARALIASAVETMPGHAALMALEARALEGDIPPIDWRATLLPARPEASADGAAASGGEMQPVSPPPSEPKTGVAPSTGDGSTNSSAGGNAVVETEPEGPADGFTDP